jgi:type III restriction enzyme
MTRSDTTHRLIRQFCARMSLRKPQERSLEILADVVASLTLPSPDLPAALQVVQELAKGDLLRVEEFERDFASLCFALATGVGKTRLMGAFISYLYLARRPVNEKPFSRNFFVLAPNTTIYEKLIDDFTPDKPKYVFKGIAEFAQNPPLIVTGDNWGEGRGLRRQGELLDADVIINVFNVDKINRDVGRIRGPHDLIGSQGYYNYLAELPDLVLLMDEAHRYRAKAGFAAIADLKPMLGLELTATPKTVGARSVDFKNVICVKGVAALRRQRQSVVHLATSGREKRREQRCGTVEALAGNGGGLRNTSCCSRGARVSRPDGDHAG